MLIQYVFLIHALFLFLITACVRCTLHFTVSQYTTESPGAPSLLLRQHNVVGIDPATAHVPSPTPRSRSRRSSGARRRGIDATPPKRMDCFQV